MRCEDGGQHHSWSDQPTWWYRRNSQLTRLQTYTLTMSIDIERFEGSREDELGRGRSQPEQVLSFLAAHPTQAFTPSEIASHVEIPQNSIGTILKRLEEKELVRHKGEYWAITDDEQRLRGFTQYQLSTETANELYGEEDPEDWIPHMPDEEREDDSDSSEDR